jgi:hypothetical protein
MILCASSQSMASYAMSLGCSYEPLFLRILRRIRLEKQERRFFLFCEYGKSARRSEFLSSLMVFS